MGEYNQRFESHQQWVNKASSWLTRRGPNMRAICFDSLGRHCTCGGDMRRADEDGAFPVHWLWPDQVGERATGALTARPQDEWHEDHGPVTWWKFPIEEAGWIGTPNDDDFPTYVTHWTPHPPIPATPTS